MPTFARDTLGVDVVKAYAKVAAGKTVLITGPSHGTIGGQAALDLAFGSPEHIILAGRSLEKIQPVIDKLGTDFPSVTVTFIKLDLADLSSVKAAAEAVTSKVDRVDVLINNAGVMGVKDYTKTREGFELQFASNHLGHFFLTGLLLPKIIAAHGRILNVSSFGYMINGVHFDDPNFEGGSYNPWIAYAQSKSANILFAKSLASRLKTTGATAFALHPGFVPDTKLQANIESDSFQDGVKIAMAALGERPMPASAMTPVSLPQSTFTILYAALAPELTEQSGAFLADAQVWEEPLMSHINDENAERLWEMSENLVGQKFGI